MKALLEISFSDLMILVGLLAIVAGIFAIYRPAGCIALGIVFLLVGLGYARGEARAAIGKAQ